MTIVQLPSLPHAQDLLRFRAAKASKVNVSEIDPSTATGKDSKVAAAAAAVGRTAIAVEIVVIAVVTVVRTDRFEQHPHFPA